MRGSRRRTGARFARFEDSSLNLLGYSAPVDVTLPRGELLEHVFTDPANPDRVPYRTSYWAERWGFCMSQREADALPEGEYRAFVDSTLVDGSLTYGEVRLDGSDPRTVLLTTTVCHPALANDNLSGIVVNRRWRERSRRSHCGTAIGSSGARGRSDHCAGCTTTAG